MMKILEKLQKKKSLLVVGLNSGTSADGIDAVLVRISGANKTMRIRQLAFVRTSYPQGLSRFVIANSLPGSSTVDTICRLNALIGHLFSEATMAVVRKAGVAASSVDLVGSHGQTVHHLPSPEQMFGTTFGSTLQIGDPSVIAARTGIPTVGDFRTADVALGGEGAPLVPLLDTLLFRSKTTSRLLLNLGGIANITLVPKDNSQDSIIAFDTGPGNMVMDALAEKLFHVPYDRNGRHAASGVVNSELLHWLMSHPYFKQPPPKSTGREEFGKTFVKECVRQARGAAAADLLATATEFTALSVYDQYVRFVRRRCSADEVLVSGGGVHNRTLMRRLQFHFGTIAVRAITDARFTADAKEAILFAVLAYETIHERAGNIPSATGAAKRVILGKICLPSL
ncbi:MAG: anhydro-N-acetylmuramic acid kinase [Ignavibacteriales bacterium]|nr:anhydro-N-acetylmuramic acid kinase [Ignavibacteriales bacterium]